MSAKFSGKVWELDLKPTEKLILLALSDHADHEGENVRPGNDLLVAKTGLTQQTVTAALAKFVEQGILEPVNDCTGRGHKREFNIILDGAPRRQYFVEREEKKAQAKRTFALKERHNSGVPFGNQKVQTGSEKVQSHSGKVQTDSCAYKEYNRQEPSENREREPLVSQTVKAPANVARFVIPASSFDPSAEESWSVGERFVLKACDLWEKPILELDPKIKISVKANGKWVNDRIDVKAQIGGTPSLFREFWFGELKRKVNPRPEYVVEQWDAYDRWLIENHETHRQGRAA